MVGATVTAGLSLRSTGLLGSLLGLSLPDIGGALLGGFYAGIIDTISGDIDAADEYQAGARYALIVSPKTHESGTDDHKWYAPGSYDGNAAKTRWDGLSAQRTLLPNADFEAFTYCDGLSHPSDDASEWYLPALDELELIYRNLKPTTVDNYTTDSSTDGWPDDPIVHGYNPSSLPQHSAYTEGSPARTTVAAFQSGGDEALEAIQGESDSFYKAATWRSSAHVFGQQTTNGRQWWSSQTSTFGIVRPVRRVSI